MKGGKLARLAAVFCSQSKFQQFTGTQDSEEAAAWIRRTCGVESRAELDNVPAATEKFHKLVRVPYVNWQLGNY